MPSPEQCATWISTILLIGLSGSVYPQAIQRIYAARSLATLKRSLSLMVFMPILTMTPIVLVGLFGLRRLGPPLEGPAADQVMPLLLAGWAAESAWLHVMALLVLVAVIAAIMSTADSVLLSLSSILAKDVLGRTALVGASEAQLTRAGKAISWVLVVVLVSLALVPRITLWGLVELKMEVLAQVWPLFVLGLHWRALTARAALAGLAAGFATASALTMAGYPRVGGIHAGLVGLGANVAICWLVTRLTPAPKHLPEFGHAVSR